MSKFIEALKGKFKTPAEALKALGMDPAILAMDESGTQTNYKDKDAHPKDSHGRFTEKTDAESENEQEGGTKHKKAGAAFAELKKLVKGKGEDMAKKAKDELDGNSGLPVPGGGKRRAMDAEQMKDFLKDKVSEDDMKALDAMCKDMKDCDEEEEAMDKKKAKDESLADKVNGAEDTVTKAAMDEAIKVATKQAHDSAIKTQREIQLALDAVNPFVGKLAMAFDSAGDVYRKALGMMKVDVASVKDDAALPIILKSQPLPGATRSAPRMATDSATGNESFTKLFGDVRPSINI